MAVIENEVATLGAIVLQSAATIQELGENFYKPSEEWSKAFPSNITTFQSKLKVWETECIKCEAPARSYEALVVRLEKARNKLLKEEKKLTKKSKRTCFTCARLNMNQFPPKIGKCLRKAIRAFDDVFEQPKYEEESVVKYEVEPQPSIDDEFRLPRPTPLPGGTDNLYVSLKVSETKLCEALTKPKGDGEGPAVILLHGGPGKGKSTLARHVARVYDQNSDNNPFQIVKILECGPQASNLAKEFELLQFLGSETVAPEDLEREFGIEGKIRKRLSTLLRERKILLLLDDVWDGQFLKGIVDLCGYQVTCLVTSHDSTLCLELKSSSVETIEIQDAVGLEDGRRILASHVRSHDNQILKHRFHNNQIPKDLMDITDKLIRETGMNPLAIVSLANVIDVNRSNEIAEWEAVSEDLFELLNSENTELIPGMKYPRTFLSTMRLTMENLPLQGQKLLLLISLCKELSVPEEVIGILYQSPIIESDTRAFSKFRNELENRELLQVTTSNRAAGSGGDSPMRMWSLHFLRKRFLEQEFKASRASLFDTLINYKSTKEQESEIVNEEQTKANKSQHTKGNVSEIVNEEQPKAEMLQPSTNGKSDIVNEEQTKARLVATLCALYFDEDFAQRAASKLGISFENVSSLKRNAIEPIILLLGRPVSEEWTEASKAFASQVVLKYICNRSLADDGMANLLLSPASAPSALRALHDVSLIDEEDAPFLECSKNGYAATLKALVKYLADGEKMELQALATATISNLAISSSFVFFPGLLEELVRLLGNDSHPEIQKNCARAIANLAKNDAVGCSLIAEYEGVIEKLVALLAVDGNPILQQEAARALGMLACGPGKISVTIITVPGALSGLVTLLSKEAHPPLQLSSAWALTCLAIWGGKSKLEIVQQPGLLPRVLKLLSDDDNPDLQNYAGIVLSILAETKETRPMMKEVEGLTQIFEDLLADNIKVSWTDRWAASILTYLDPSLGNAKRLEAYEPLLERARANCVLGLYKESLTDLKKCAKLEPEDGSIFSNRCTVKGMLKNFKGALKDANHAIQLDRSLPLLTERGFLKRVTGDLDGAIADFTEALEMKTVFIHSLKYEAWKQRGYVKFLKNDHEGARADAEAAFRSEPARVEELGYGSCALDQSPVEYLGYKLK